MDSVARTLRLRHLAWVLLGGVAVVGALGAYQAVANGPRALSLDYERTLPAFWSGALLWTAALGAALVARDPAMPGPRWPWWGLAALFAFMGVDEIVAIHERLARLTGLRWELPYIPVIVGALAVGLAALRRLWRERSPLAIGFVFAAGTWAVSQVFEVVQWDDGVKVGAYTTLMVIEEIGEMTGSALFALTLFAWVLRPEAAAAGTAATAGRVRRGAPATRLHG